MAADQATRPRLLGRPELERLVGLALDDFIDPAQTLSNFDSFNVYLFLSPQVRGYVIDMYGGLETHVDFEKRTGLSVARADFYSALENPDVDPYKCAREGIAETITTGNPKADLDSHHNRINHVARTPWLVSDFLMKEDAFRENFASIIELRLPKLEVGRHFFVYGVSLGVQVRQEQRKAQEVRSRS